MNLMEFNFSATECNGWPKLKFYIDDDLYEDYKFCSDEAKIFLPIELLNGKHLLQIELYGKTQNNTVVDKNNTIIKDQLVILNSIKLDNVQLPEMFLYLGRFTGNPNFPQLTWGVNGFWNWTFETPIIDWAIFVRNNASENINSDLTVTSSFSNEKNTKLLNLLDIMEHELNNDKFS
jgi:hypothetical protein